MNILLTGATRGLGLCIAQRLLASGNTLIGVARSESREFTTLQARYEDSARFVACDLSDTATIKESIFTQLLEVPIHGLVNNAAIAYDDLATNLDQTQLNSMFQANVFAPMELTKLTIRNMLLHKTRGSLVHISSISAHTGYKGLAMYAATKGAIEAYSKNIAREWGRMGIRSNCVVAGFMETSMSASLSEEQKRRIYQRTALKSAADPRTVAETVAFLLSEQSCSITGQNLFVDAGTI